MNEKKHYLTPLKSRSQPSRHLLLWIDADESQPCLQATFRRAWDMIVHDQGAKLLASYTWDISKQLDGGLDHVFGGKGAVTIWLCRGWEDLCLSGLAELIDQHIIKFRYARLDGQKILIRGEWRGRPLIITSLANWTGRRWDNWPKVAADESCRRLAQGWEQAARQNGAEIGERERLAIQTFLAIVLTAKLTGDASIQPTVAGAAKRMWRRWLGPQFQVERRPGEGKKRRNGHDMKTVVAPSPFRPEKAAAAERHVCYGLFNRQFRRGHVTERITVMDLRSAYALALACAPLPCYYQRTLHTPSVDELGDAVEKSTALALVRLASIDCPYPARRGRTVVPAIGEFWTWLTGAELAHALMNDHVWECQTAILWADAPVSAKTSHCLLSLSSCLEREGRVGLLAGWRALYSSLVGQFAGRRQRWEDMPAEPAVERWSQWWKGDQKTGHIVPCRSIAGRQQQLITEDYTSAAVPLVYGAITSFVRWLMARLCAIAGWENVLWCYADALWLTDTGWQRIRDDAETSGLPRDYIRSKEIYDEAWMDGKSSAVMRRGDKHIYRCPGVPEGTTLSPSGTVQELAAVPWSQQPSIEAQGGVRRTLRRFPGAKLMERYREPAITLPIGEQIDDPLLPAELLEKVSYARSIIDE